MRSRPEWIGKHDDQDPPLWVFERRWEASGGRCEGCHRSLTAADKWDLDHVKRVRDGGENRESNLQVLCLWCHAHKTAHENKRGAKAARTFAVHHAVKKESKKPWPFTRLFKRKINGTVVRR